MERRREDFFSDLFEAILIILLTTVLLFREPFGLYSRLVDFLHLKYPIFTSEPSLLYLAVQYSGAFFAKATALAFIVALVIAKKRGLSGILGVRPPSADWKSFILPYAALSILIRLYFSADPLVPNLPVRFVSSEAMFVGNLFIVPSVLLVAPVAEELIVRGYLFGTFERTLGPYAAIILTTIFFCILHLANYSFNLANIAILMVSDLIIGFARFKTGSVLVAMLMHGIFNAVSLIIGLIFFFLLGY